MLLSIVDAVFGPIHICNREFLADVVIYCFLNCHSYQLGGGFFLDFPLLGTPVVYFFCRQCQMVVLAMVMFQAMALIRIPSHLSFITARFSPGDNSDF